MASEQSSALNNDHISEEGTSIFDGLLYDDVDVEGDSDTGEEESIDGDGDTAMESDNDELIDPSFATPQAKYSDQFYYGLAGKSVVEKIEAILDTIVLAGLDLSGFINAICWGNLACTASMKVHYH